MLRLVILAAAVFEISCG